MSSWEDIANEVAPPGTETPPALATGARRGKAGKRGNLGEVFGVSRYLECPPAARGDAPETVWNGWQESGRDGNYYFIDRAVTAYDSEGENLGARLQNALKNPPSSWLEGLSLEDLIFCDIETTGLSSANPLFLIGTMIFVESQPRLQLYLARDLNEEKAILSAFGSKLRGKTLVTFNGKSFDWPFIEGRATRNLVKLPSPQGHFDLLFAARRRWRSQLPNCRLQTLEMGICGRGRQGDIPSSQIPERYYDFLEMAQTKGQGAHLLAPILFHNALDVLTMAELICCMAEGK
ncbi:putative RNase H superfamily protein [Abditibacterium utsteinense]|uniref:Putative RNase H superfamily protein n=1 Tax=Abditibacterium utsteinense TaxID=1960156 RepID=A0A2S8SWK0_9BACT|nr:ribonuclease H-like domain-containing protein [Abditibacterium utsteinense]PQV65186.1 putative RNase H superfamily protein [Abditibacterium utsteinense]